METELRYFTKILTRWSRLRKVQFGTNQARNPEWSSRRGKSILSMSEAKRLIDRTAIPPELAY
jgi:hypothetical protein